MFMGKLNKAFGYNNLYTKVYFVLFQRFVWKKFESFFFFYLDYITSHCFSVSSLFTEIARKKGKINKNDASNFEEIILGSLLGNSNASLIANVSGKGTTYKRNF